MQHCRSATNLNSWNAAKPEHLIIGKMLHAGGSKIKTTKDI